jgi:hypothetical protein
MYVVRTPFVAVFRPIQGLRMPSVASADALGPSSRVITRPRTTRYARKTVRFAKSHVSHWKALSPQRSPAPTAVYAPRRADGRPQHRRPGLKGTSIGQQIRYSKLGSFRKTDLFSQNVYPLRPRSTRRGVRTAVCDASAGDRKPQVSVRTSIAANWVRFAKRMSLDCRPLTTTTRRTEDVRTSRHGGTPEP